MKISSDKKKEMLLNSFDILKNNFRENSFELSKIIQQVASFNLETAVEMWKYLIKNNSEVLKGSDGDDLGPDIMYAISKSAGDEEVWRLVADDEFLKTAIYQECSCLMWQPLEGICFFIKNDELEKANELMQLVFTNKNNRNSIYQVIDTVIPKSPKISDDAFGMIMEWIENVKNKQDKVKLNLRMLAFMDVE